MVSWHNANISAPTYFIGGWKLKLISKAVYGCQNNYNSFHWCFQQKIYKFLVICLFLQRQISSYNTVCLHVQLCSLREILEKLAACRCFLDDVFFMVVCEMTDVRLLLLLTQSSWQISFSASKYEMNPVSSLLGLQHCVDMGLLHRLWRFRNSRFFRGRVTPRPIRTLED